MDWMKMALVPIRWTHVSSGIQMFPVTLKCPWAKETWWLRQREEDEEEDWMEGVTIGGMRMTVESIDPPPPPRHSAYHLPPPLFWQGSWRRDRQYY